MEVVGAAVKDQAMILSAEALGFVEKLEKAFGLRRQECLSARQDRQARLTSGEALSFLSETRAVREGEWTVAACPPDLEKRWVEITGPAEPKMMINALNSGADAFMADLEDALSPTWENVILGQKALFDAVRGDLSFTSNEGKSYRLNEKTATLLVRPRGWHLVEKHVLLDGKPVSASLFDFGLYFFHNAGERVRRGTAPYFYLPKMESHREARLWNDVFVFAQKELGIPVGTIRATMLIETLPAAFEMDEMLFELREHASGLNAGRWDYIFSAIKKLRASPNAILPDRAQVTMTAPFMRAYTELLVKTCHRRNAHAMGGMAAFVPSRKDEAVNRVAFQKVEEDKRREVNDGFDGTWVAHPDLVPVARQVFESRLGSKSHQKDRLREEVNVDPQDLVVLRVPGGQVTEAGVRANVNVALQYIERWLSGQGAVAIHNLMEDAATAEIARAQLWQWIRFEVRLSSGESMNRMFYERIRDEELTRLGGRANVRLDQAAMILDSLVVNSSFTEFLTTVAYGNLD